MKMSPASIGINLRVTGHCSQGGRKYMEDFFSVAYQQSENEKDLEYAFFGIFDGHGGSEAARFAKEHLMNEIVSQKIFWSDSDEDVLRAIREGYMQTHYAMWRKQEKWPKTATGLPSTAGTTASVAFIRKGKIYIGHVGDSGIVLGYQENGDKFWKAKPLTLDHKPECNKEKARIMNSGGKVVIKSGVPRVVWNRPRVGHKGPVRRSTPFDEIPFLAVARSLGDLWSYNSALNEFVVSPDPDVHVVKIDPKTFRCLIFGTDGLWNVISSNDSIEIAREAEIINERLIFMGGGTASMNDWRNPSKCLVDKALERWSIRKMRADNTSVVTVMLDPPGLPKRDISRQLSTASFGLEYVEMEGEINTQNDYSAVENSLGDNIRVNQSQDSDDYYYTANGHNLNTNQEIGMDSCYLQNCYTNNTIQRYDSSSDTDFPYFENPIGSPGLDNSSSNFLYESCLSSSSMVSTSSTSVNHQQQQQQGDIYSNGMCFAESYNSLLLSSLENDSSSSSSSSSGSGSGSSSSSDSSGEEDNGKDVQHIYQSLNETGLAGHDHVYHHYPNINTEQQQRQYQQACMLDADGYSLTKLETRCEQRLRNYICTTNPSIKTNLRLEQQQQQLHQQQHRPNTFQQTFNNDVLASASASYNQYDRITSGYNLNNLNTINEKKSLNLNENQSKELNTLPPPPQCLETKEVIIVDSVEHVKDTNNIIIDNNVLTPNAAEDNCSKTNQKIHGELLLINIDESIQINEISSSFSETNSPQSSPLSKTDNDLKTIDKKNREQQHPVTTTSSKLFKKLENCKTTTTPIITRASKLRFSLKQNDENVSITERQQTNRYSKRTLRSRNSLSKDLKAKSTNKKSQQHQIKRTIVSNEFLKIANGSSSASSTSSDSTSNNGLFCKLRSRQHCSNQQPSNKAKLQQQQHVTVWPITRSRRTTTNYNIIPPKSLALSANNCNTNLNINLRNMNSNLRCCNIINLRNHSMNNPSSNHTKNSTKPNRLHNKIIQNGATSTTTTGTKRSTTSARNNTSANSNWCTTKNIVQTRNRVQNVKSLMKK